MARPTDPWSYPPERTELIWIAVDFDGTLCNSRWTPGHPEYEIGEPIWENLAKATELVAHGYKVIVHTARPWSHYEAIESWLDHYDVTYSRIVCGKLLAFRYIDDRGISARQDSWLDDAS